MGKLFLLFTVVPFVELYLLVRLSGVIGFGTTLLVVVLTGVLGASLARAEGLRVIQQWRQATAEGRVPEGGVLSGALVLVGGVLLVTPGVLTDLLGLCLLVPATRALIAGFVAARITRAIERGRIHVVTQQPGPPPGGFDPMGPQGGEPKVIDVESEWADSEEP